MASKRDKLSRFIEDVQSSVERRKRSQRESRTSESRESASPDSGSPSSGASAREVSEPGAQSEVLPVRDSERIGPPNIVDSLRRAGEKRLKKGARKVLTEAFDERKGDLEDVAVNALRRALVEESETIERLIERSIEIKKREVRLSLIVLLVGTTLYVLLAVLFG